MRRIALACLAAAAVASCGDPLVSGAFRGATTETGTTTGGSVITLGHPGGSDTGGTTTGGTPPAPVVLTCPNNGYGAPKAIVGTAGGVQAPYDLKLAKNDAPVLAWTYTAEAYVARWNGSAWTGWANSDTKGVGPTNSGVSLVLDGNDTPYVAWGVFAGEAFLKRWNGTSWTGMDGSASGHVAYYNNTEFQAVPAIALGMYANLPALAWAQMSGLNPPNPSTEVALSYFDGKNWSAGIPQPSASMITTGANSVSLMNDRNGRLIVGWSAGRASIGIFDQNTIEPMGVAEGPQSYYNVSDEFGLVNEPVTMGQNANGQLLLGWTDVNNPNGPYVGFNTTGTVVWSGQANSMNGLEPNQAAHHVAMATDKNNNPWLVWEDGAGHIAMRYFNGTAWVESNGSATGNGVSGSAVATWPKVAFTSTNQPVLSWVENGNTLRVCAWNPPAP